jgi:hypothetical protein
MKKHRTVLFAKLFIHGLLPLITGAVIYILYRPAAWFTRLLNLDNCREQSSENFSAFGRFIIYSGPDFFWAYSFASVVFILNHIYKCGSHRLLFIIVLLVAEISEMIQLFIPSVFTFSFTDLFAITAGVFFAAILNKTS